MTVHLEDESEGVWDYVSVSFIVDIEYKKQLQPFKSLEVELSRICWSVTHEFSF